MKPFASVDHAMADRGVNPPAADPGDSDWPDVSQSTRGSTAASHVRNCSRRFPLRLLANLSRDGCLRAEAFHLAPAHALLVAVRGAVRGDHLKLHARLPAFSTRTFIDVFILVHENSAGRGAAMNSSGKSARIESRPGLRREMLFREDDMNFPKELQKSKQVVREWVRANFSDQKLASVAAFNADGKMSFRDPCGCLMGVTYSDPLDGRWLRSRALLARAPAGSGAAWPLRRVISNVARRKADGGA